MRAFSLRGTALALTTTGFVLAHAISTMPMMASEAPAVIADTTPTRVLSVVSGGFWETTAEEKEQAEGEAKETDTEAKKPAAEQNNRGYYRSLAIRSEDNTSRLYLQRIWLSPDGPMLLDTREIEALTEMKAYITDMRPENSTGIAKQPGFVTFVYLKGDPAAGEPDTWELYVDEFGDTAFTPASN
ncbi:hypothetical protein [Hoeflea sp. TYP-13]|uniref:hypothetical protein n=1 Tax=Hoeflea sp. TYP-13 TaxID=3230023 RepID=UPI0034C5C985